MRLHVCICVCVYLGVHLWCVRVRVCLCLFSCFKKEPARSKGKALVRFVERFQKKQALGQIEEEAVSMLGLSSTDLPVLRFFADSFLQQCVAASSGGAS